MEVQNGGEIPKVISSPNTVGRSYRKIEPLPIPFPEVCPRTCATINSLQEGKLRWPVVQNRELGVMASYRKLLQYSSFHFQINSRICLPAYNKVSWVLYNLNIIPIWSNWCNWRMFMKSIYVDRTLI